MAYDEEDGRKERWEEKGRDKLQKIKDCRLTPIIASTEQMCAL